MKRNTLTQRLRALEALVTSEPAVPESFSFADGRYTIRVANDLESRKKAYGLVYRLYLEKEYAKPHPSKMWLSIYDALPQTVTLLVEKNEATDCRPQTTGTTGAARDCSPLSSGLQPVACRLKPAVPVGALTVVFDSPMGLPADKVYRPELDGLRASGRRLAEVVSLGVAEEAQAGSQVLVKLFNFAYFIARGVRRSTDFVVTVNPRHVRFYERLMRFAEAGEERGYDKVGGAPAVLLRLDFDAAEAQRVQSSGRGVRGTGRNPEPETRNPRSIYTQFRAASEEPEVVDALGASLRPMTERELGYFLVAETDVLREASPEQRSCLRNRRNELFAHAGSGSRSA